MVSSHLPSRSPWRRITLTGLPGPYGVLEVNARDDGSVELSLADGDFVTLRREHWLLLREIVSLLYDSQPAVVARSLRTGEPIVLEPREARFATDGLLKRGRPTRGVDRHGR